VKKQTEKKGNNTHRENLYLTNDIQKNRKNSVQKLVIQNQKLPGKHLNFFSIRLIIKKKKFS